MKTKKIIYSKKFKFRLEAIAEYLLEQSKSKEISREHVLNIKSSLGILSRFPFVGREAEEFGEEIRKIIILDYTVLYCVNEKLEQIEVLNIFRENLP